MAIEEGGHGSDSEGVGEHRRRKIGPPAGRSAAEGKNNPAEHARVGKHEALFALDQDKMIVFLRNIAGRFSPEFATHAEVNTQPAVAGSPPPTLIELEQHLLGGGGGGAQGRAGELTNQSGGIFAAKHPGTRMHEHPAHLPAPAGIPSFTVVLDLGQFGHA